MCKPGASQPETANEIAVIPPLKKPADEVGADQAPERLTLRRASESTGGHRQFRQDFKSRCLAVLAETGSRKVGLRGETDGWPGLGLADDGRSHEIS